MSEFGNLRAVTFDLEGTLLFGESPIIQVRENLLGDIQELQKAGIKYGVITDDRIAVAREKLGEVGLTNSLLLSEDIIGIGSTMPTRIKGRASEIPSKPSPVAIKHLLKRWGVRPERALHIGDSPDDSNMAANAGVEFVKASVDDMFEVSILDLIQQSKLAGNN